MPDPSSRPRTRGETSRETGREPGREVQSELRRLGEGQAAVVSRAQLLGLGLTSAQARAPLESGRWQTVLPGVYLTHRGEVTPHVRVWAAVLAAGPGAVAGPFTTLWLQGLADTRPRLVDLWIPHERRVRPGPEIWVRRRQGLESDTHPVASPPQLRLERAVLEVCREVPRTEAAVDVLIRAVQRRRTTADRLLGELARDRAHHRRGLVEDVLSDVRDGVQSQLERAWVRLVERPHGLPSATLNVAERDGRSRRYRDLKYEEWGVVGELDGRESHPDDERFRDRERDNQVALSGRVPLRYGWREVAGDACGVAGQVATALQRNGWPERPDPCSQTCTIHSWGTSCPP